MQYDKQIHLSVANTRFGPWQVQESSLSSFYTKLSQPARSTETRQNYLALSKREQDRLKDVGGFVGGTLRGGMRRNGHVVGRELITLDLDNVEPGGSQRVIRILETLGCGFAVYSTRKHAPESPRLRVILPLTVPLSEDEYEPAARYAAKIIDPTMTLFDRTTFEACRMMYWPSVCSDGEYVFYYADKPYVDGRALLSLFNWQDVLSWPTCPDEGAAVKRSAQKQQDPTTKEGIVGAFCRVYDVCSAIDKFLPDIYVPVDRCDDRYTFTGGSTSGGAVLYEDGKFLYSHHATDPAGGQLCNAFDLVRLHLFGEQDADAKPGTPVGRLPSWQVMTKFAEKDPAVHEQKVSDRAEAIKRDFAPMIAAHSSPSEPCNAVSSTGVSQPCQTVNTGFGVQDVGDVMKQLAEMLEDGSRKVTSPLIEAAMNAMGLRVGRNEITNALAIAGMPDVYSLQEAPNILPVLISDFLRGNDVNAAPETVAQYISVIADKNRFNPVRTWLTCYPWDGCDRWPVVYEILGIEGQQNTKYQTYIRKWFMQSVAMAMNDLARPRSADGALVLQGEQGCGKTLFFRKMASGGANWFAEGVSIDFTNKDTVIKGTSAWITELGELDSTLKREQSALKAFITAESDDIRLPYARSSVKRARCTSFCGTVNPENFLRDETGSRRFWVIPVKKIDVDTLLHISPDTVHQIWLQAYSEWLCDPEQYRLGREDRKQLESDNRRFGMSVLWQEEIEDLMDWDIPNEERCEMTAAFMARNILRNGAKAEAVGRALAQISKDHPCVEYKRSSGSRKWLLPIKKSIMVLHNSAV